jgi:N-acetylglucosamine-6-phosphate deacetylase
MSDRLNILNARIVSGGSVTAPCDIFIEGKTIRRIQPANSRAEGHKDAIEIDANGKYVSPGFIDIHVHGGAGFDFMDGDERGFLEIANLHARHGTTSMLPTTLSSTFEEMVHTLTAYEGAHKLNDRGARFLGMHLEGPYFAMNQRGAQDPRYIRDPDPAEYMEILSRFPFVKRWSAAPEKNGAMEFGRYVKSMGVLPAIAHTDAIYEEVLEAYNNGYTLITHLYSAMSGVTRRNAFRYAGVIESAFIIDDIDVEIIADGVHLPAPLLKMVYKIKGPDRIALITDAMRAAGMPEGESILGSLKNGLKVVVEDGVAKLPDRTSFAGSVATADRLVRTMVQQAEIPLAEAIKMITQTPARIMGVSGQAGCVAEGMDADLAIFDDNIDVSTTIRQGKIIFPFNSR